MRSDHLAALAIGLVLTAASKHAIAQRYTSPVGVNVDVGSKLLGSAFSMNMSGAGAGTNGPQTAQFGTNQACDKNQWTFTQNVGEIDCFQVNVQQGGPNSDARGVVIKTQNTGLGFSNGTEMAVSSYRGSDNSFPYYLDTQIADITSDGYMAGAVFNSIAGSATAGIVVDAGSSGSWNNVFQATKNGKAFFTITGSGSILTSGKVTTTGLVTSDVTHATSFHITPLSASSVVQATSCGTTMRSLNNVPLTLIVPGSLPLGCHINVIQAGAGPVVFRGRNMKEEHLGTPDGWNVESKSTGAQVSLLIDTPETFLLTGDVEGLRPKALALVSDVHVDGTDERLAPSP